ncbi:phosphatase PAP2 family protein [Paenibacillus sp. IHBB 10380]|uniref:phosphatase PAP2 family protein n=1 Tax=Paenibacillus sp. IHBB 10380 TaxID=1566358 RepID=UPI000698CB6F|nr:phosphatase PAP2 family protein [Paenibacillus sp. IHBB 10380]
MIDQPIKTYLRSLSLLGSLGIMGIFYTLLNGRSHGAFILNSPIDQMIPVIPAMGIVYLGWYPFIFIAMAYLCWKDRQLYIRTLITMNISLIFCYLIYYYFQTSVPRPIVTGNSWDVLILQYIYSQDQPFNCFPSIHALHSYLVLRAAWISKVIRKRARIVISICSILIIVSTFMIKQHVIYDALGAILLSEAVILLLQAALRIRKKAHIKWYERYS